jgi:hypothetical protein
MTMFRIGFRLRWPWEFYAAVNLTEKNGGRAYTCVNGPTPENVRRQVRQYLDAMSRGK